MFPVEPYDQQIEYVRNLVAALNEAQHSLLEYPRGGGRTLALLAGCLGWLYRRAELQEATLPKVFFVCRAYSRLPDVGWRHQIIAQVKKEVYKYSVAVLGSRDQLCVNPTLSDCSGREKASRCRNLVQNKECQFYNTYAGKRDAVVQTYQGKAMDIEEWVAEGKSQKFCPFYASRNLVGQANLVLLPFELLTDPRYLSLIEAYLAQAVLIIEDADLFEGFVLEVRDCHPEPIGLAESFDARSSSRRAAQSEGKSPRV